MEKEKEKAKAKAKAKEKESFLQGLNWTERQEK